MKRSRFIVTSISAAAIGTALATDACSTTGGLRNLLPGSAGLAGRESGAAGYTLTVKYATTNIKGYMLRGRTYDGRTHGKTLVTRPGETLSVKIVNELPKDLPLAIPRPGSELVPTDEMEAMMAMPGGPMRPNTGVDPMNNPHNFNTTNLHTHGLQTIPHLFDPIGTSNPAAEMIQIHPGKSLQYNFPIPKDHPSGLHWYHPHNHGSTDVQVSNGMAGLIVVRGPIDEVPEIKAAREIFMVVQTLDVNLNKKTGVYEREYYPYRSAANGGYSLGTNFTMITTNGEGVCWVENAVTKYGQYNQLSVPEFTVAPGEIVRWRFLNGSNYIPLCLALPGFEAWIVAFDGVNVLESVPVDISGKGVTTITPANLFSAPIMLAHSANRIELLLQAPATPGTYTMSSLATNGVRFKPIPKIDLANFTVTGAPVSMKFPTKLPTPTREYPVITPKDVVQKRTFVLNVGTDTSLLTGVGFTINNIVYQMDQCETAPKVGTCEEWRLENAHTEAHPFHLHENSFQLIEINGKEVSPMEVWDTFTIPPKVNGVNGSITIRIRFVEWYGKTVFHCHILPHEDTGMMQNILMV